MNSHHEKRVRQLLGITDNNKDGSRGVIPPATVRAIERIEKMILKLGSNSGLRASELAILLTAIEARYEVEEPVTETIAETAEPEVVMEESESIIVTAPKKRGRPRKG